MTITNPEHESVSILLGAYAVDALDAGERALVETHLAACPACRAEVDGHREALAGLVTDAPAPPALWDRIADELRPQVQRTQEPEIRAEGDATGQTGNVIPLRRRRWIAAAAGAAAAVAAAVAITVAVVSEPGLGDPDLVAAIAPADVATPVSGSVRLYDTDSPSGVLVVDLSSVPAAPDGHHYEVWVLRESTGGAMEAVGAFRPAAGSEELELRLPGPGRYVAVDISVQPDGGPAEHSGVSLAGATLS